MTSPAYASPPIGAHFSAVVLRPAPPHPVRLALTGELDLAAAAALGVALAEVLSGPTQPPRVQVDLTSVTFMDTAGMEEFLHVRATLEQLGVRVEMLGAQGQCLRLMRVAARLGWLRTAVASDLPGTGGD